MFKINWCLIEFFFVVKILAIRIYKYSKKYFCCKITLIEQKIQRRLKQCSQTITELPLITTESV